MAEYLGQLGRLVELRCSSQERIDVAERYVSEITVEGRRRVQVIPERPRAWDVSWAVGRSTQLTPLLDFFSGAWGGGPWHWVPVLAHRANLLTPREAVLLDRVSSTALTDAGPVRGADGVWAPRSVSVSLSSGWVALVRGIPVLAGAPFTWSADVQGGSSSPAVQVAFYDAAGTQLSTTAATGTGTGMQRVSVTVTAPAGAVSAWGGVRSSTVVAARPQATWTDGPVPVAPGHGCRSAVIDGLSENVLMANRRGSYASLSFTVLEVA